VIVAIGTKGMDRKALAPLKREEKKSRHTPSRFKGTRGKKVIAGVVRRKKRAARTLPASVEVTEFSG